MSTDEKTLQYQGLRLIVEQLGGVPGRGRVALVNEGEAAVRVWRAGSQWGDAVLSFAGQRAGTTVHVVPGPRIYTVNVRSAVLVPGGASHRWPFDFGDGTWEADLPFQRWAGPGAELTALYRVDADPDSLAYGVLIGSLRSEPVAWHG